MRQSNHSFGTVDDEVMGRFMNAYLSELDSYLSEMVPAEAHEHFKQEAAFWLEQSLNDNMLGDSSFEEASKKAIRKIGKPRVVADQMIEEYYENGVDTPLFNRLGRGNCTAGALFGMANLVYLIVLQTRVYIPSGDAPGIHASPATLRGFWPEPLPFPEFSWQFGLMVGYPLLVPLVLGWVCGRMIPVRAYLSIYHSMMLILLSAYLLGAMLLPNTEALLFAVFQTVWWLPVGCLSAYISSLFLRRSRRRKTRGERPLSVLPANLY